MITEEQKRAALEWLDDNMTWIENHDIYVTLYEGIKNLSPAPVDAEVREAVKTVRNELAKHGCWRDMHVATETLIRAATKNMGDAVTREDTVLVETLIEGALPRLEATSPATSPTPDWLDKKAAMADAQKVCDLTKSCEGLVKALEYIVRNSEEHDCVTLAKRALAEHLQKKGCAEVCGETDTNGNPLCCKNGAR